MQTHESYIQAVKAAVLGNTDSEARDALEPVKIVYGTGRPTLRGQCLHGAWSREDSRLCLIEVCALGQSDPVQLAGTTIHELGHALAGCGVGHGKEWKAACKRLGLLNAKAKGTDYTPESFDVDLWAHLELIPPPEDGNPYAHRERPSGPCGAGAGSRGGKSQGPGSGSRLLAVECDECECKLRMTRKWVEQAGLPTCGCGGSMNLA